MTSLLRPRFILLALACSLLPGLAFASDFKVGAAIVDITPKEGTPMAGYYKFRAVAGVRDPIFAKTIVVEQDGSQAAFVVLDLAGTTRPVVDAARKAIEEQCHLAGNRVMISATHTHTGPQLPRGSLMDDITKANSPSGLNYIESLPGLIARSVKEAQDRLAPAKASCAIGKAEGISFNRRVLRDGVQQAIWQPKKIDTTKEHPAGPVDPDVGLIVFDSLKPGSPPLAAYVNFAMHPTSIGGGTRVSADYPGVLCKLLTERHGGMPTVFSNGCCGNINHTNYLTDKPQLNTEQLGTALADAATGAWMHRDSLQTFAPRVLSRTITLPRRHFTEAEIAKAKDIGVRMVTENLGTVPMAEAVCILETVAKKDVHLQVEVQTIAFSDDLAVVSLPGEIFVELGLTIKAQSPFKRTIIAELANGSIGYIPNREAYPQGNYEVVSARAEAGAGETLVTTALEMLKELKSAK